MRKYVVAAAAAIGSVGTAHAAPPPSITFTQGVYSIPSYTSATVFETFNKGAGNGSQYDPATQSSGVYAEGVAGDVLTFPGSQDVNGVSINPGDAPDTYLSIGSANNPGQFTVGFGSGVQYFSFDFGSLDTYNSLRLYFSDGTSQLLTGLGIINGASQNVDPGTAPMSYNNGGIKGRVSYNANGGPAITYAQFGSSQSAFEIDDLAAAAPEPGTWTMMILGFGLVGGALRLRRRKANIAFA